MTDQGAQGGETDSVLKLPESGVDDVHGSGRNDTGGCKATTQYTAFSAFGILATAASWVLLLWVSMKNGAKLHQMDMGIAFLGLICMIRSLGTMFKSEHKHGSQFANGFCVALSCTDIVLHYFLLYYGGEKYEGPHMIHIWFNTLLLLLHGLQYGVDAQKHYMNKPKAMQRTKHSRRLLYEDDEKRTKAILFPAICSDGLMQYFYTLLSILLNVWLLRTATPEEQQSTDMICLHAVYLCSSVVLPTMMYTWRKKSNDWNWFLYIMFVLLDAVLILWYAIYRDASTAQGAVVIMIKAVVLILLLGSPVFAFFHGMEWGSESQVLRYKNDQGLTALSEWLFSHSHAEGRFVMATSMGGIVSAIAATISIVIGSWWLVLVTAIVGGLCGTVFGFLAFECASCLRKSRLCSGCVSLKETKHTIFEVILKLPVVTIFEYFLWYITVRRVLTIEIRLIPFYRCHVGLCGCGSVVQSFTKARHHGVSLLYLLYSLVFKRASPSQNHRLRFGKFCATASTFLLYWL
jgi:hypothetical protein